MEVTKKSRLQIRIQNGIFYLAFLAIVGLTAWLSTRYQIQADWTANSRNTLSEASQQLLKTLDGPVTLTAYARENEALRQNIRALAERYRRVKGDLKLEFVNPDTHPDQVRQLGISMDGELIIAYQGRSENLKQLNEEAITNTLQRLARGSERFLVYLEGHGERKAQGEANHDLGNFSAELTRKGIKSQNLNLAASGAIPSNTATLVIAGPQVELLPGEVAMISDYVSQGGNLLWLLDPGPTHGLDLLAQQLGFEPLPGMVVDANTQLFGINNPAYAIVPDYPDHAISRAMDSITLFPQATALDYEPLEGWETTQLLQTLPRSWSETGDISGQVSYDEEKGDTLGPLTLGLVMTQNREPPQENGDAAGEQRIAIIGDGDFLANAYLGNGGNLNLGLNLVNWLLHEDKLIAIEPKTAPDLSLNLSQTSSIVISAGFLILLPLLLLGSGITIWWKRRRR